MALGYFLMLSAIISATGVTAIFIRRNLAVTLMAIVGAVVLAKREH